jgi:hypothetical protein
MTPLQDRSMRGFLASSTGVAASAALVLSLASVAVAAPPRALPGPPAQAPDLPGSTRSLPLAPLPAALPALPPAPRSAVHGRSAAPWAALVPEPSAAAVRTPGETPAGTSAGSASRNAVAAAPGRALSVPRTRPFSLLGVVWTDPAAHLHGIVEARTRAVGSGEWSGWRSVETHGAGGDSGHGADPETAEAATAGARGATAPLWVGPSDGAQVRVTPLAGPDGAAEPLPEGLRLELVDPGGVPPVTAEDALADAAASVTAAGNAGGAAGLAAVSGAVSGAVSEVPAGLPAVVRGMGAAPAPDGAWPAVTATVTGAGITAGTETAPGATLAVTPARTELAVAAKKYIGARPAIVTRKKWGADESLREKGFAYTKSVKAAFVHHSYTGNAYTCRQAPSVLRSIYRYHVVSSGWRDFGYNFAVDKCGNIYEGRAGGVTRAVLGAHTKGFNSNSMGIAVLGTYSRTNPPKAVLTALARLTAWKLGLFQGNPRGRVTLTSGGSDKYTKGRKVRFHVISGHQDGVLTDCPGARLYKKLATIRSASASYQGRG